MRGAGGEGWRLHSGVHPGAAIDVAIGQGSFEHGAICAILARRSEPSRPTHIVTCGHLFAPGARDTAVLAASSPHAPLEVVGSLEVNLLDPGSPFPPPRLDAALVSLSPRGVAQAFQGTGVGPILTGVFSEDVVFNRRSRSFQPTTGDYSRTTWTLESPLDVHVGDVPLWPEGFDVKGGVGTTSPVSEPGDSGTVLAALEPVWAIGVCSASDSTYSLWEPLGRVLRVLQPTHHLTLWRDV